MEPFVSQLLAVPTETQQDLKTRREQVVDAHIQAETEAHDIGAALATFRHPRYEVPAFGSIADGADAVEGLLGQLLGAFPDFWLQRIATHHAEDAVIVECRFGGTHQGEWAGVSPTGKQMEVQAACVFLFEGADLVCEKVYFDHATVLRQLAE
jgi:predicted ester cyclase